MGSLKPYSEYKEIGLPWLQSIPINWTVGKNKFVMKPKKNRVGVTHKNMVLLSLTKQGIITRDTVNLKGKYPSDFDAYQAVQDGDIVFCLFDIDETPRAVGLSRLNGMITGAYSVFEMEGVNKSFIYYYYLAIDNNKLLKPYYTGLRKVVNVDTFLGIKLPLPPKEEQDQIVRYLDSKLAKINKFIRNKKRLIELLKEQKQAVINQAVTKGLDPNAKMKPSGVEWLGDVPEGWALRKLKKLGSFKSGLNLTTVAMNEKDKFPVYGGNGIRGYYNQHTHQGEYILIGRQGALCGNVHYVEDSFWATEHAIVFAATSNTNLKWAKNMLEVMNLNQYSQSAAQPGLSVDRIINIKTMLPPYSDQIAIAEFLEKQTQTIDHTINRINKELDLITEYRTTLISAVVTGKVDVRGIEVEDPSTEDLTALEPAALDGDDPQEDEPIENIESEVG